MLQPRKCFGYNVYSCKNNEEIISSDERSGDSVSGSDTKMVGIAGSGSGVQKTWSKLTSKSILIYVICIAVLARIDPIHCQEIEVEGSEDIEITRLRRDVGGGERGNQNSAGEFNKKAGRYLSVKPVIGLLTSTARTFIQDGVTTEYATQILGTTLDNGRIYAQVLTKSSLVLYNKPSDRDDPYIVKATKLPSFDGSWNVKQDLGFINPDKFVLKNTDYISPQSDKMFTVYASKPVKHDYTKLWNAEIEPDITSRFGEQEIPEETPVRIQELKDIPRYSENDNFNLLDAPVSDNERRIKTYTNSIVSENKDKEISFRNDKTINFPADIKEQASNQQEVTVENVAPVEIRPEKVKPDANLPTYTVKNEFSPIFYYIDNVESKKDSQKEHQVDNPNRNPKKIFAHKSESRPKTTFTYEGFADFTTIVGDTVIVFTPNTAKVSPGQQGERLEQLEPSAIPDFKKELVTNVKQVVPTNAPILLHPTFIRPEDPVRSSKALKNDEDSLNNVLYENAMSNEDQSLDSSTESMLDVAISLQDNSRFHNDHNFGLNVDVIQPSEISYTTLKRAQATQILEKSQLESVIFNPDINSIVLTPSIKKIPKSETVFEVTPEIQSEEVTEHIIPETEVTTETLKETTTQTSSTVKDGDEEKEEVTSSQDDVEGSDIEESPIETHSEDATCTDGIIPVSTMTTAYKTLTYLTTFFIPLEGTETTTSIKSHEVLASDVGFITNFECKTKLIQPSEVVPVVIQTRIQSSSGDGASVDSFIETATKAEVDSLTTTERPKELIENQEDTTTSTEATTQRKTTEIKEEYTEHMTEDQHTTTTEHSVTTSESHLAITVTTEKEPDTTTLKSFKEAEESNVNDMSGVNNNENEIDLIYKTLYTTYRYFTTFFEGSTSTVSTHKSVVTNVITSTVDWSNIDPSIIKAFDDEYDGKNDYEIAPTSVGIGRPTESLVINSLIDLVQHRDVLESVQNDQAYTTRLPTPELSEGYIDRIKPDAVKTYYTTYTFFTTIYVGNDANICSRSEIYTNYVGPESLVPTATIKLGDMATKKTEFDFRNCKQVSGLKKGQEVEEDSRMSISEEEGDLNIDRYHSYSSIIRTPAFEQPTEPSPIEVDMLFSVAPDFEDGRFVTDVKSSSSKGDKMIIDNAVLDDQISSESNIDEIMPSPTLLLQTSYTTFTYFTTMYIGKDSSNIKSRLETITNVVTETLSPKRQQDQIEEANLPITYYTTFTYWTTLYKDKSTTITSREEIISNIVKPSVLPAPIVLSPIDTDPIEVETNQSKEIDIQPSVMIDDLNQDDEKATFYTTYTYFTTFYVGNTSQIRSSLETVTNIVDNTKYPIDDNQIARAVGNGAAKNNLVNEDVKPHIVPTVLKEMIKPTKLEQSSISTTSLIGTYIDNLYAEVQPIISSSIAKPDTEPRILSSQVAIISGDSTIITNEYNSINNESNVDVAAITTSPLITSPTPDVIQSSVTDPTTPEDIEEPDGEQEGEEDVEEDDGSNKKKRTRLTYQTQSRTFTPVIRPFVSRNRPTFSPKRVSLVGGATTITRSDFTPTITATPALKSVKSTGFSVKKQPSSSIINGSSRRFSGGRGSSVSGAPSGSRSAGFGRSKSILDIQPSSRRTGFRSSSTGFNLNTPNRGASSRTSPSLSSRVRGKTLSSSARYQDYSTTIIFDEEENNEQTSTEAVDETSEAGIRKTNNPTFKFRRPGARAPGSGPAQRTTPIPSSRKSSSTRGRVTTTTSRTTTKTTPNPLFALRNRNRPNALFPPRGFFKQPEPQVEEANNEEQEVNQEEGEQFAEDEDFNDDSDYDSSDKKEEQVSTTQTPRRNSPLIRPFVGFRRRTKRQVDYGTRKYSNFRRPGIRTSPTNKRADVEPEPDTEAPTTQRSRGRFTAKSSFSRAASAPMTTTSSPKTSRKPFIIRGESRTTPPSTSGSSFRSRGRSSTRTPKSSSNLRPSAPRLKTNNLKNSYMESARTNSRNSARASGTSSRSGTRGRSNSRFKTTNDNNEGNQINQIHNDGKITVTHHIPSEVTVSVVNGKITEYKNLITAKPSLEVLQPNQYSTSIGQFGNPQLVIASESTDLAENGATRVIKYVLQETPTTAVIFTPTTIRGRRTSYSHIIPSTVYNVEAVTSTLSPEISPNVPLANILLSQLLLGNAQQQQINPLLALQGQAQLQGPATPVTEFKTRTTSYVTTVIDEKSTVIPLTFRGKEILTTIVDSKTNVITATEFITDTFVTTPTLFPQQNPNQINSLLLPLLLQQQQHQSLLQTANPLQGLSPDLSQTTNNNLLPGNDLYNNSPKPDILEVDNNYDDVYVDESVEEETIVTEAPRKPFRKNRPKANKPSPRQSSVVTLYVSGRTPGEFSTVLSTVYDDSNVRKREAIYFENVNIKSTDLPRFDEIYASQSDVLLDNLLLPKDVENPTSDNQMETQSLESIIGEVSRYISLGSSNKVIEDSSPPTEVLRIIESDFSKA